MSCVKLATDFRQICLHNSLNIGNEVEFFFEIPRFAMIPSDEALSSQKLPPSVRVIKSSPCEITGSCDVKYCIEARVLRGDKVVAHTCREIIVLPTSEIPPPTDPRDLKDDFRLMTSSSLGSFWNSAKSLTLVLSTAEPRPVVYRIEKGEYGSTEVALNFKTRAALEDIESVLGGYLTSCDVTVNLEAITYFLEHEQDSVMSIAEALKSPSTVLKKSTFKTGRGTFIFPVGKWVARLAVCSLKTLNQNAC